ncbi:DUF4347 domain-containing protein [Gloeothece verrucosa]|uniref:LVIVD repeat protein n=1 Tax=Gloeothece verrucosa (strain PCC 7822) TaxID=497965 RepID=E0ULH3_GLOV7|nr:DUF4347 domain-containing protein [Gloeothece verrucosa]ADN17803.1 LVIVD repeat protein [Gloeothece verrucosa PCC 7822]
MLQSAMQAQFIESLSQIKLSSKIVFIDAGVENYQSLMTQSLPDIEVILIPTNRDGIEQITEVLRHRQDIDTVHLVSHGSPGCLYLGNTQLNLETLNKYGNSLKQWFSVTNPNLLLYGCNVAAGNVGKEFVKKLHQLTEANIRASATPTGNAKLGGNWELEVTVGANCLSSLAFNLESLKDYSSVLLTPVLVGTYDTPGYARNVQVVNNLAYVADYRSGLQIIDITNPASPVLKGTYSGNAWNVQVVGNLAYVKELIILLMRLWMCKW